MKLIHNINAKGETLPISFHNFKDIMCALMETKDSEFDLDMAVIPIRNSIIGYIDGALDAILDAVSRYSNIRLKIHSILNISINHALFVPKNSISAKLLHEGLFEDALKHISKIYSHDAALKQCSNFIELFLKINDGNCKVESVSSTVMGLKKVIQSIENTQNANDQCEAAISSEDSYNITCNSSLDNSKYTHGINVADWLQVGASQELITNSPIMKSSSFKNFTSFFVLKRHEWTLDTCSFPKRNENRLVLIALDGTKLHQLLAEIPKLSGDIQILSITSRSRPSGNLDTRVGSEYNENANPHLLTGLLSFWIELTATNPELIEPIRSYILENICKKFDVVIL